MTDELTEGQHPGGAVVLVVAIGDEEAGVRGAEVAIIKTDVVLLRVGAERGGTERNQCAGADESAETSNHPKQLPRVNAIHLQTSLTL